MEIDGSQPQLNECKEGSAVVKKQRPRRIVCEALLAQCDESSCRIPVFMYSPRTFVRYDPRAFPLSARILPPIDLPDLEHGSSPARSALAARRLVALSTLAMAQLSINPMGEGGRASMGRTKELRLHRAVVPCVMQQWPANGRPSVRVLSKVGARHQCLCSSFNRGHQLDSSHKSYVMLPFRSQADP